MDHQQNTASLLVRCLEAEGVEYVFGIPGEENLEIIKAIHNSSIKFIVTRHEQGAAFMADVYGRLTGRAGVCLSTLGPGATNLVTGVADAHSDGAPLIAITGQVSTDKMHITSHQFLDLVKMFEPITKRSKQVMRPDSVGEIVRIAFKYAESEKPGACHIDIPVDISKLPVPDNLNPIKKQKFQLIEHADLNCIEVAAGAIFRAKRPVMLVGSGAVRHGASAAITAFAEKLKIPVINTMMAKGVISFANQYSMWTIGIPQKDYANKIIESADLVIAVGYDLVEYAPSKWNLQSPDIIHIDTRASHINKLYQPLVEVIGDISDSLNMIANRTSRKDEPDFALSIKSRMTDEFEAYRNDLSFPMKPQKILMDLRKVMGKNDIVISDVGAHKMWIARHYNCYTPNTCIISNGFASMGIALPGAIVAKLIYPERRVLAVCGDGGFMMNCQEMETALRIGTPGVVLIFNDSSYGLIKWKQLDQYGESCCVDFTNPDYVKFAESMGAKGYRVESADQLLPILEDAFSQKISSIIDCRVDYSENVKLTKYLKENYANLPHAED